MNYVPEDDGVTHINIYSKGKTELGRWLTNFADSPFYHPEYGYFRTMEGFWYWLKTGMQYDQLREVYGFQAKELGRKWPAVEVERFEDKIKNAIRIKLLSHPHMLNKLIDSTLPLTHYYVYGGKLVPAGYEWITEYIENIRTACQQTNWRA